jgi:hypothetical protein
MAGPLVYDNLDLLFRSVGDAYQVLVTHAPGGADVPAQTFEVPFDDRDLEVFVLRLRGSKGRARAIDSPETQQARDMGRDLYRALFKDRLATTLSRSLDRCEALSQGLRLRLNFTETPALLNLPWEFLYDESTKRFLSLRDETPIVRYLAVDHRVDRLRTPLPVRVLVMVSNPDDPSYEELDVEQEKAKLKTAVSGLEDAGQLFLDFIPATLRDLTDALDNNTYHVFHFIGHGGFDEASNESALVLEGDRRASISGGQHLGQLLADHSSLRLVVLNACEGARSANNDPFAGVAQTLLQQGVPAVVAMQFEITDEAAVTFSEGFYTSLTRGRPVDVAVSDARKGVYSIPNYTEWATPVLYMRSTDGVLFDLEVSAKTQDGVGLAERLEAERLEAERLEAERVEAERVEAERVEAERVEAERVEAERVEAERVEAERVEVPVDLEEPSASILQTAPLPDRDAATPLMWAEESSMKQAPGAPGAKRRDRSNRTKRSNSSKRDVQLEKIMRREVRPGRVAFEAPRRMDLYEHRTVKVAMTRSLDLDDVLREAVGSSVEGPLMVKETSPLMEVLLSGDGFEIDARSKSEQYVAAGQATVWEFSVVAKERGRHELVLAISMRLPVPGYPDLYQSAPSITRYINVEVSGPAQVGYFAKRNWKWLVTTGIAAAGVAIAVGAH